MTIAELLETLNDKPENIAWDEWWAMPIMLDRGDCLQQAEMDCSGVVEMDVIDENGDCNENSDPLLAFFISIDKKASLNDSMILRITKDQLN